MRETTQNVPDIRPRPDPTVLTTAALRLSIENLESLLTAKINAGDALLDEKIAHNFAMDEKRHRETREWIALLKEHRLEAKADRDRAIQSAFLAQKELFDQQRECTDEAAAKAEQSFAKQIEAIAREAAISRENLYTKIADLKEQVDKKAGRAEQVVETRGSTQWAVGLVVALVLALISNVVTIIYIFTTHR